MKIAVAISGGVDSSTVLYLLKKAGHEIFGLFMKNWEERDNQNQCWSKKDQEDVAKVCSLLNVPYYTINFSKEYWEEVFIHFLKDIRAGYTPNPDILCNREIKFNLLLQKALTLGANKLATGHYCRIQDNKLLKGKDPQKDQSYFLYTLKKKHFPFLLFPLGGMCKSQVRKIAKEANLPVHDKKDSTGICFIGKRNFKTFLEKYIPNQVGIFKDSEGNIVGTHDGAVYYTIGQRKGIKIGGKGEAWFVVDKDIKNNVVFVAQGKNHPALFAQDLLATEVSWIGNLPHSFPYICKAKIRYHHKEEICTITHKEKDQIYVSFKNPQRAITPRQSIVFYHGDICLGGAIIKSSQSKKMKVLSLK